MARNAVTAGARPRRRPVRARRRAALDALVASAPAILPTYDMVYGSPAGKFFTQATLEAGFSELGGDAWPCEQQFMIDDGTVVFRDGNAAVHRLPDGTLASVSLAYGWFHVSVSSPLEGRVAEVCSAFRASYPASYMIEDSGRVPITFWSLGRMGPEPRLRKIDAATWPDVEGNYTSAVRDELARLMLWESGSESDGQLILWQGPPGTGKSWALRALASEWSSWAEFHYITDPDSFFVKDPSYMIQVLLSDSYETIDAPTGDVYSEADPEGKWRVLILEDTGELLAADAKEEYGQGLSRLLNVVDGMIGQGLRVLALVTTNDELGDLHPAAVRPGRCASQIEFAPLTAAEAAAWTGDPDAEAGTIAELYSRYGRAADDALPARDPDFTPEPEDARDLMASGDLIPIPGAPGWAVPKDALDAAIALAGGCRCESCATGPRHASDCAVHNEPAFANGPCDCGALTTSTDAAPAEVAEVAAEHAPDGGYGDTWWRASDSTVFWNAADWSTDEERAAAEEAFLGVDGVEGFESDSEVGHPDGTDDWQRIYPAADSAAALDEIIRLASEPLPLEPDATPADMVDPDALVDELQRTLSAAGANVEGKVMPELAEALRAVAESHRLTVESIQTIVASAGQVRDSGREDTLALATLGVLNSFLTRPAAEAPKAGDVHVHVPKHDLNVKVEGTTFSPQIDVHVPAPEPMPAPHVDVHLGDQKIDVHVPEQPAPVVHVAAAPPADVHVHVPSAPEPAARAKTVTVGFDESGNKTFRVEEDATHE